MPDVIAAFRTEHYEPLAKELVADTMLALDAEAATNCVIAISDAIAQAAAEQQTAGLPPMACLTISVLYTSAYFGQPKLRLDFYTSAWPIADALYSQTIDAAWLFTHWREHEDALTQAAKGHGAWVRRAHLESMRWQSVRLLACLLASHLKYWLQDGLHAAPALQALQREDQFCILFGEYQDWQTPVFALQPPPDLASCSFNNLLRFSAYQSSRYRCQTFRQLDLSASRFDDCVFEDCTFDGVDLSDVLFHHCRLRRCDFRQVRLSGARFSRTQLRHSQLYDVQAEPLREDAGRIEFYRHLAFVDCWLDDIQLVNCRLAGARLTDSSVEHLTIQGGDYSNSDFLPWLSPSQESEASQP